MQPGRKQEPRSTSWLLSQREDIPFFFFFFLQEEKRGGGRKGGGRGGRGGWHFEGEARVIVPKPQGGSDRKRQGWWIETTLGGEGDCGDPRCSQRPCEPLDSLSGLSAACREREVGEKGVRGEGKVNRGGGFYVSRQ